MAPSPRAVNQPVRASHSWTRTERRERPLTASHSWTYADPRSTTAPVEPTRRAA